MGWCWDGSLGGGTAGSGDRLDRMEWSEDHDHAEPVLVLVLGG